MEWGVAVWKGHKRKRGLPPATPTTSNVCGKSLYGKDRIGREGFYLLLPPPEQLWDGKSLYGRVTILRGAPPASPINLWNLMLQEESVKDLTVINDVKFLGVYLDCHLSWNKHVNELVLKLKKDIF